MIGTSIFLEKQKGASVLSGWAIETETKTHTEIATCRLNSEYLIKQQEGTGQRLCVDH